MSTDQTIFGQQTPSAASGGTPPTVQDQSQFADLLMSIKNEQGQPKYKDVQTALEALRHSQEYIPQLKQDKEKTDAELARISAELERLKNIEQTVTQLTQQQQSQQTPSAPVFDETKVAELVNKTLTQKETEALRARNLQTVVASVQQSFGEKAEETFYTKAKELGMSADQINSLAAQSPTAVLKLFGIEQVKTPVATTTVPAAPSTSVNSAALKPAQNSFIGKNTSTTSVGATTADLQAERENSKKLVEELHSKGMTTYDLSDPKTYFKHFN